MIADNVEHIRRRIAAACTQAGRQVNAITLVAVSKTFTSKRIQEVTETGVFDIGENYVREMVQKRDEVKDERIRWHFIGHLQTNKVKYIGGWVHLIQAVDSLHLGKEISKFWQKGGRTIDVLVEVNTLGEATKYGVRPEQATGLVEGLVKLPSVRVQGLMTIGPFLPNPEDSRPAFRTLRHIKERIEEKGIALPHLSMGMTNDFEVAIEEGATIIRIGTAIFGQRVKFEKQ